MDDISKTKGSPEEEEDALSLSDFPIPNSSEPAADAKNHKTQDNKRRSSSEPSDFFEFFTNDFRSDNNISHAEDIIFRGKLVPFRNHHHFLKSLSADDATRRSNLRSPIELVPTVTSNSTRHSRSFSKRPARPEGFSPSKPPRWFVLMFGPLKFHPEMDLREMKSRRGRRSPRSMFPSMEAAGVDVPSGRRSFWGFDLLRVLSCKSHASVAVTASVGLVPRL